MRLRICSGGDTEVNLSEQQQTEQSNQLFKSSASSAKNEKINTTTISNSRQLEKIPPSPPKSRSTTTIGCFAEHSTSATCPNSSGSSLALPSFPAASTDFYHRSRISLVSRSDIRYGATLRINWRRAILTMADMSVLYTKSTPIPLP